LEGASENPFPAFSAFPPPLIGLRLNLRDLSWSQYCNRDFNSSHCSRVHHKGMEMEDMMDYHLRLEYAEKKASGIGISSKAFSSEA